MKSTLPRRFIAVASAALALFLSSQSALVATAPTTLEIGPKEIILNSQAINSGGLGYYGECPDNPWNVAYDGTSGAIAYQMNAGGTEDDGAMKVVGTLDNPLATSHSSIIRINDVYTDVLTDPQTHLGNQWLYTGMKPPLDSAQWVDPVKYPLYVSVGPTYRLSDGKLLGWYTAEQDIDGGNPYYYNYLGMALSTDDGDGWTDLGTIMYPSVSYNPTEGLEVATGWPDRVVVDPSNSYYYLYSNSYVATVGRTYVTVAEAPISAVNSAAENMTTTTWTNYYDGSFSQAANGGLVSYLLSDVYGGETTIPNDGFYSWTSETWNQYLKKYIFISSNLWGMGPTIYSESTDGIHWALGRTIMPGDFDSTGYETVVGIEPNIPNGLGWANNGEFYVESESNLQSEITPAPTYLARRKVYVLDNFDNDTTGSLPSETGWTRHSGFAAAYVETSPTSSADHPNSLLIDAASGATGDEKAYYVNGVDTSAPSMEFHAEVYPTSLGGSSGGLDFDMENGASSTVFNVAIFDTSSTGNYSDYTLQYYDGTKWNLVGGANGHLGTKNILNNWHRIEINATNTSYATVLFDHTVHGTISHWDSASTMDRVLINAGAGNAYVDNVFLYPSQPTDTFENNTYGAAAQGGTMVPNAWSVVATDGSSDVLVSDNEPYTGGYANAFGPGSQSMEIKDSSSTLGTVKATRGADPTSSKWLEAQIYPKSLGSGSGAYLGIFLNAVGISDIFDVAIVPPGGINSYSDYTVQYYNGAWNLVSHLGTSGILDDWHQIDIDATSTTSGTVYFEIAPGNMTSGTITNWETATSPNLNSAQFYFQSSTATGLDVYVDNVYFSPALLNDSDFAFDGAGTLPWGYSLVTGTAPTLVNDSTPTIGIAGYDGPNALYVSDPSTPASVEKIVTPPTAEIGGPGLSGGSVDFEIYPKAISSNGAIYIDLNYGSTNVLHLQIIANAGGGATLQCDEADVWTTLGSDGALALNAWNEISIIDANSNSTTTTSTNNPSTEKENVIIHENGTQVSGNNMPYASNLTAAATIDRVVFSCKTTGDVFYIDDVVTNN